MDNFEWLYLCNGSFDSHRAVIFAIAQLSCFNAWIDKDKNYWLNTVWKIQASTANLFLCSRRFLDQNFLNVWRIFAIRAT